MPSVHAIVAALVAAALMGGVVATLALPRLRRRRAASPEPAPAPAAAAPRSHASPPVARPELVCPGCDREYPAGLRFCPHDARALLPMEHRPDRATALFCPACRRNFEGRARFCPFDAEELIPAPSVHVVAARAAGHLPRAMGKICPRCSHRYETDAIICRQDGAELVSVN